MSQKGQIRGSQSPLKELRSFLKLIFLFWKTSQKWGVDVVRVHVLVYDVQYTVVGIVERVSPTAGREGSRRVSV